MIRIKEHIRKMFSSFGRNPDENEQTVQTYVEMLNNFEPKDVAEAILKLSLSSKRLPPVSEIVSVLREQRFSSSQAGKRNLDAHTQQVNLWYKSAVDAGWSLPMRDELVDLCDRLIDKETGQWRAGGENQMRRDVANLVAAVKSFRARQEEARATGSLMPDESLEDWAWAIPGAGERDWDPAAESLWEYAKRVKDQPAESSRLEQFAWNP
jgi:hypothetical protein